MEKIAEGSKEEIKIFEHIYFSFFRQLVHYASNFIPGDHAVDVIQEIFYKLWRSKRSVLSQFDDNELRAYLFHSVLNACRDYAKHQKVEQTYVSRILHAIRLEEFNFHETLLLFEKKERQLDDIHAEIDNLPEKCREIFRCYYLRQESCAHIAAKMNISIRTVEAQLYKALKLIRRAVKKNTETRK